MPRLFKIGADLFPDLASEIVENAWIEFHRTAFFYVIKIFPLFLAIFVI